MQYMLLVYGSEQLSASARSDETPFESDMTWLQHLAASRRAGTIGLHPGSTATTLQEHDGRVSITDGPYGETSDALSAFQLIECENLDDAIAIASRLPALRFGFSIEVRPVITK